MSITVRPPEDMVPTFPTVDNMHLWNNAIEVARFEFWGSQVREIEFLISAISGNALRLQQFIKEGVNLIGRVDSWLAAHAPGCGLDETALHLAARSTNGEAIKVIIEAAKIQGKINNLINAIGGEYDETALHVACSNFSISAEHLRLMVNAGANVTSNGREGKTPLHYLFLNEDPSLSLSKLSSERRTMHPTYERMAAVVDVIIKPKKEIVKTLITQTVTTLPHELIALIVNYCRFTCPSTMNAFSQSGTVFQFACSFFNPKIQNPKLWDDRLNTIRFMLSHGADPSDGVSELKRCKDFPDRMKGFDFQVKSLLEEEIKIREQEGEADEETWSARQILLPVEAQRERIRCSMCSQCSLM